MQGQALTIQILVDLSQFMPAGNLSLEKEGAKFRCGSDYVAFTALGF